MKLNSHAYLWLIHLYRGVLERCRESGAWVANLPQSLFGFAGGGKTAPSGAVNLERLDPRVLLSVTPSMSGSLAFLTGDSAADSVTLTVDYNNDLVYSFNNGGTYSSDFNPNVAGNQTFNVSSGRVISVNLGAGDDRLIIPDGSLLARLQATNSQLLLDGGTGTTDSFRASPVTAGSYSLTGSEGLLGNLISFRNFTQIESGNLADTFRLSNGPVTTKIIDRSGLTTLEAFTGPVELRRDIVASGGLLINALDTVTVASGVRISTRTTSSNGDSVSAPSTGNSGDLTIKAKSITAEAGSILTASADGVYTGGEVTLAASDVSIIGAPTLGISAESASIILRGSVRGNDIFVTTSARDLVPGGARGRVFNSEQDHDPNDGVNDSDPFGLGELTLAGVEATIASTLPVVVMRKRSESLIQLDSGATITGAGNVVIASSALSDASIEINPPFISIGYAYAFADARVLLRTGSSVTGGNITIASDSNTIVEMDAETNTRLGAIPGDPLRAAIALAISSTDTTSLATVEQGANVHARENVNIDAVGTGKSVASAETGSYANGRAGVAVALDFATSNIGANVAGWVISYAPADRVATFNGETAADISNDQINLNTDHDFRTGQPVVYHIPQNTRPIAGLRDGETYYVIRVPGSNTQIKLAESAAKAMDGDAIDLWQVGSSALNTLDPEFTPGVGIHATMASENSASATGGFGASANSLQRDILYGDVDGGDIIGALASKYGTAAAADGRSSSNTNLAIAGAVAFSMTDNTVQATLQPTAIILSRADFELKSSLEETFQGAAESTVDSNPDAPINNAVSASVIVGLFDNTSRAEVKGSARVDAVGEINIESELTYPPLTPPLEALNPTDFLFKADSASSFQTGLGEVMDGKLGIASRLFNTWSRSTAQATNLGICGSVTYLNLDNTSEAIIRANASINRQESNGPNQAVNVKASTDIQMVNMDGIFGIDVTDETLRNLRNAGDRWAILNPMGNQQAKGGVGGSVFIQDMDNYTTAKIEGAARVTVASEEALTVDASEKLNNFVLVQSGGRALKFGVSGSFGLTNNTSNVLAQIDSGANITAGTITIHAASELNQLIAMGATQRGGNAGVGATVGINDTTRNTSAVLGSLVGNAPGASTITTYQGLNIKAEGLGSMGVFTVAAAQVANPVPAGGTPDNPPAGQDDDPLDGESLPNLFGDGAANSPGSSDKTFQDKGKQGGSGIAISGDVAIDEVTDNVRAYINDSGTITASYLGALPTGTQTYVIKADNDTSFVGASGSVAIASTAGTNSAGIAGSVSVVKLAGTTSAFIAGGGQVRAPGNNMDLSIKANREGVLAAGAAGGSGNVGNNGAAVSGSVCILNIADTTSTLIEGMRISGVSSLVMDSKNSAIIVGVAGAVALGGRAGVGASISVNTIDLVTTSKITLNSTIQNCGMRVQAVNDAEIWCIAGAGASGSSVGVAGTVAINHIHNTTEASTTNLTQTSNFSFPVADMTLRAADTSSISVLAGAVGVSGNNGFGGALAYNDISNSTTAQVYGSTLLPRRSVSITAESTADISSITAGVGISQGNALAGSVSINRVTNNVQASAIGSTILTTGSEPGGSTLVKASDSGTIRSLAGAVSGANSNALGASVSANLVRDTVLASVGRSVINTPSRSVQVEASGSASITAITAGGAGANSFAGGGAVSVNTIGGTVTAQVNTASDIDASSVTIKAASADTIQSLSGGVAGAGSNAVGASLGLNDIGVVTVAEVSNADVTATAGDILVTADQTSEISAITAGGSGAGTFALGGALSIANEHNLTEVRAVDGADLIASDTVLLGASDSMNANLLAGGVAGAGSNAVGAAASVLVTNNDTNAFVQGSTVVANSAGGASDGATFFTGGRNSNGTRTTGTFAGAVVLATSFEKIVNIAAGGAGGGSNGIAGSVSVASLDETTSATIDDRSVVNSYPSVLSAGRDVVVGAFDSTDLLGIGGALAAGGTGGIGAGADGSRIVKSTTANAAGDIDAARNVIIQAGSSEDVTSVGGAVGAGGSAAIAGAADIQVYTITTRASVNDNDPNGGNTPSVLSRGSVAIAAEHALTLNSIAGTITGSGSAGVGASLALPIVTNTTEAFVGRNARVDAYGHNGTVSVGDGTFSEQMVAESPDVRVPARPGGTETVNRPGVDAPVLNNSDISSPLATGQLSVTPNRATLRGVAISAVNRSDIETISASGGASGSVAATIAGGALVVNNTTKAYADQSSQININVNLSTGASIDQQVLIAAGSHLYHLGVAGSAAFSGVVGAAPGADLTLVANTVQAYVEDYAQVKAAYGITIRANTQQDILTVAAGLSGTGQVAIGGSLSLLKVTDTTQAFIGNFAKVASGSVQVLAIDDTTSVMISGSAGIGLGIGGLGASVGVNLITKNTSATIEADAEVVGSDSGIAQVKVDARSSEDLFTIVAAGGGGQFAGLAGAVGVNIVESNTTAAILERASINPTIRATLPGSVSVTANNDLDIEDIAGAASVGGLGGLSGALDLGIIRGNTSARIANGANIRATNLTVGATSTRDIDSAMASVGGGGMGISGSVSVYTIGGLINGDSSSILASGAQSIGPFVDTNIVNELNGRLSSVGSGYSSTDRNGTDPAPDATQIFGSAMQDARSAMNANSSSSVSSSTSSTTPRGGTTASIDDGAIVSYQVLSVLASGTVNAIGTAGAAAGGASSIGGSGVIFTNTAPVSASVSGTLTNRYVAESGLGGSATVNATQTVSMQGTAFAGALGSLALGAQLIELTDSSSVTAVVAAGANFSAEYSLTVQSNANRQLDANAIGGAIGGVGAGISLASAVITGPVKSQIISGARFSTNVVGNVSVLTDSTAYANADAIAVAAGTISGAGADATASSTPVVEASIGAGTRLEGTRTDGDVNVIANSYTKDTAEANGVSVALIGTLGLSRATATSTPTVLALIGNNSFINGDSIVVQARQNVTPEGTLLVNNKASATARAGGGGLVGAAGGALTTATNSPNVRGEIGTGCDINAAFHAAVGAEAANVAYAESTGAAVGYVALGLSSATSTASGTTKAIINTNTDVDTTDAFIGLRARAYDSASSLSIAAAGGMFAAGVNLAQSTVRPEVKSTTGDRVDLVAGTSIGISTESEVHSLSEVRGAAVGGVAIMGTSQAWATTWPTVETAVGNYGSLLSKTSQINIQTAANYTALPNVFLVADAARAIATASVRGAIATDLDATSVKIESNVSAATRIGSFTTIIAGRDVTPGRNEGILRIRADAGNDSSINASSDLAGAIALGGTRLESNITTHATLYINDVSRLQSTDQMFLTSNAVTIARATGTGGSGRTITDFLRTMFTGGLSQAFANPPGILGAGGIMVVFNIDSNVLTRLGYDVQIVASNLEVKALASTTAITNVSMRSGGALAAEATAMAVVNADPDAQIRIDPGAQLSAVNITILAENVLAFDVNAGAVVAADIGGADATALTRVNIGVNATSGGGSLAEVYIDRNASLMADQRIEITAATRQADPTVRLLSGPTATAAGGVIANARALADGSVNVGARVETVAGSQIVAPTTVVRGNCDAAALQLDRRPVASATTIISRTISVARTVVDRIVDWLPWPFDAIVRFVTRTVFDLITVFDLSSSSGVQGGSGVQYSNGLTHNGTITNQRPVNRRLVIDPRNLGPGPGDEGNNIGYHMDGRGIVLDDVVSEGQIHVTIDFPNGVIDGDGEIKVNSYIENVEIVNNTDDNLVVDVMEMILGEHGDVTPFEPQIDMHSGSGEVRVNRDLVHTHLVIRDNGLGDVILTQPIENVCADITIIAAGNILAADPSVFIEFGDLGALTLHAGGDIGSTETPLHIRGIRGKYMPDGMASDMPVLIDATAGGGVYLDVTGENEVYGEVLDGQYRVDGIFFEIHAGGPIQLDISHSEILDNQLSIHHADGVYDLTDLVSTSGDIVVNIASGSARVSHMSTPGSVFLTVSGDVIAGDASGISASTLLVRAGGSIGDSVEVLPTQVQTFAAVSGGSVFMHNRRGMQVGTVDGVSGITAAGTVILDTTGGLEIRSDVSAGDDLIIGVHDTPGSDDRILVAQGAKVASGGLLELEAGDEVLVEEGAGLSASGSVLLLADIDDADPGLGGVVRVLGSVDAPIVDVTTGVDADTIDLSGLAQSGVLVTIQSGDGNDSITASGSDDLILAGAGADRVLPSPGNDVVSDAEFIDDRLTGHAVAGQRGDDFIFAITAGRSVAFRAVRINGNAALTMLVLDENGQVIATGSDSVEFKSDHEGRYTVRVAAASGSGDFALKAAQSVKVQSVVVNDGEQQRSHLSSVTVKFDGQVALGDLVSSGQITSLVAIRNRSKGNRLVSFDRSHYSFDPMNNSLTVDFTVDGFGGSARSAVADGRYDISIDSAGIRAANGAMLVDSGGRLDAKLLVDRSNGSATQDLFQLTGDLDGSASVDLGDMVILLPRINTSDLAGDINGDGVVDMTDFSLLARNWKARLP